MVSVTIKDGESVDKALKRFKKKFEKARVLKELRERTAFEKPSIWKRKQVQRAAYKLTMQSKNAE